ncbi:MAG: hypothetical protein Q9198_002427 [Flavoplaca austrocitrina]
MLRLGGTLPANLPPQCPLVSQPRRWRNTLTLNSCRSKSWNWDYTGEDNKIRESSRTHPPCLCGPKGLETYDWAKAAGLSGFETFWHRCKYILRDEEVGFEWPEGVTFVDYPADTGNKDFKVSKP